MDTSIWIDYFKGQRTQETNGLVKLLGSQPIAVEELILSELNTYSMLRVENAVKSAENFRSLQKRGITIRKTGDVIIATYCIEHNHSLLFSDKDFLPFVKYMGLQKEEV